MIGVKNNIMTISGTMVMDFTPVFAITTGALNHSFAALQATRECVIAIPTVDMLDQVVGIGTCSGPTPTNSPSSGSRRLGATCQGTADRGVASPTSSAGSSTSSVRTTSSCSKALPPIWIPGAGKRTVHVVGDGASSSMADGSTGAR